MDSSPEDINVCYHTALLREKLLLAALQGGIEDIARVGSDVLGHPVLLGDAILTILAWTGAPALRKLSWEGFIHAGYAPDFQAERALFAERSILLPYEFEACQVRNPLKGWIDLLIDIPCGHAAAHLVVSGEGSPFTDECYELLGLLCRCISAQLRRQAEGAEWVFGYSSENFLLQLAKGEVPDEQVLRFRAGLAGIAVEADYVLLLVDFTSYHPVSHSISTIRAALDEALSGDSVIMDHTLAVLCRCSQCTQENQKKVAALLAQNHLQGIWGNPFCHLADLPLSYTKTLRLLALRACGEDAPLLKGETLEIYYLVDLYVQKEGRLPLDHPILQLLMAADRSGKTDFLNTLYTYLHWSRKPALVCDKLHIHRNTLDYRLRRMEELTEIDWNDGNLLFRLYFQLSALRYERMRPWTPQNR